MEKATEAREKNDQGAELDAINLAVVNSIASDLTGLVNTTALKQGLTGLVKGNLDTIIDSTKTEWEVEGNTGRLYKITNTGNVEIASTVNITKDGEIVTELSYNSDEIELNTTTIQLNATPTPDLTINSVTWESGTPSVASIDNTGLVTLKDKGSTTITLTANTPGGYFTKNCKITIVKTLEIGDSVPYSTTLNNTILNDWSVFYINGDYTYIILNNYLPNAAIGSFTGKKTSGTYKVNTTTNREDLIGAMTNTSNWSDLINNGKINGIVLDSEIKNNINVWAMGSPTIELWVNSWNASYPNDMLYIAYENPVIDQTYDGWYMSLTNPATTTSQNLGNKTGYSNTLYYPYKQNIDCRGYWLASPSASWSNDVVVVYYEGSITSNSHKFNPHYAFRPVICLPSSIFE